MRILDMNTPKNSSNNIDSNTTENSCPINNEDTNTSDYTSNSYVHKIFWSTGILITASLSFVHSPLKLIAKIGRFILALCTLPFFPLTIAILFNIKHISKVEFNNVKPNGFLLNILLIFPYWIFLGMLALLYLNLDYGLDLHKDSLALAYRIQAFLTLTFCGTTLFTIFYLLFIKNSSINQQLSNYKQTCLTLKIMLRHIAQLLFFVIGLNVLCYLFLFVPLSLAKMVILYLSVVIKLPYEITYFIPFRFYTLLGLVIYTGVWGYALTEFNKRLK